MAQVAFVIVVFCPVWPLCLNSYFTSAVILLVSPHSLETWFIPVAFLPNPHVLPAVPLFLWQLDGISILSANFREISISFCFKACSIKEHIPVIKKPGLGLMCDTTLCHRYIFLLNLDLVLCQSKYPSIPP